MVGDIWNIVKRGITLADAINRYNAALEAIRDDVTYLKISIRSVTQEVEHLRAEAAADKRELLLEFENRLLKLDRATSNSPNRSSKSLTKNRRRSKS